MHDMPSPVPRTNPSNETGWLIAIVLFGVLLRLSAVFLYSHEPESDELAYLSMAKSLVAGSRMIDGGGNHAFYNMGYPFLVLAPSLLVFPDSMLAMRLANILCGAASIALVYAVAREAGAGRIARLLSALLWAGYLPSGVYAVYLAKENAMIPLMLGVLWCALRMSRSFNYRCAILCGGLLGLLALTGNAALSLAAAVVAALFMSNAAPRIRLLSIPIMALVAGLVVTPWLVRNMSVVGAPVLNTNGGFNLYLGNNPAADGMYMSIADTPRGVTWNAMHDEQGELVASDTLKREAMAWISQHPGQFMLLTLKKLGLFWMPPVHDGRDGSTGTEKIIRLSWLIQFLVLAGGALASARFAVDRRRQVILWAAIAAYSSVHMLFYVIFRYREPIMPVVCVLAASAFEPLIVRVLEFGRRLPMDLEDPEEQAGFNDGGLR